MTADEVARAIVAACRETGDDPVEVGSGGFVRDRGKRHPRARHYAYLALRWLHPDGDETAVARAVGAHPQKARGYADSVRYQILGRGRAIYGGRPQANWLEWPVLERVVAATRPGVLVTRVAPAPRLTETAVMDLGDPPPERSALAGYLERERLRVEREREP